MYNCFVILMLLVNHSGCLVTLSFMKTQERLGSRGTAQQMGWYYLHRYLRYVASNKYSRTRMWEEGVKQRCGGSGDGEI